jgi:4,5-DOPA dioxygenase extradiol
MIRMPVLFVGHGSPMNAIEDNDWTRQWQALGRQLPRPSAILAISAHWYTQGTRVMDEPLPRQVYDLYGFPPALYNLKYPAPGAPDLGRITRGLIESHPVVIDNNWGIDHGTWSVLTRMYPEADIPVTQLSIDRQAPADVHFAIGQQIRPLREQGVLILGSGNVVHNLRLVDWGNPGGTAWAERFDAAIETSIRQNDFKAVQNYEQLGDAARLAVPTPDHFLPLLYVLGATDPQDPMTVFNRSAIYGSLSMTGYLFG